MRNVDFAFRFSVLVGSKSPSRLPSSTVVVQRHDQTAVITIDDVPDDAFRNDGLPTAALLARAEYEFLLWAKEKFDDVIISWECRLGSQTGALMSSFRSYLPL